MFTTIAHVGAGFGPGFGPGLFLILAPLFWLAVIAILFAIFGRRWRRARLAGYGPHGWHSPSRGAEQTLAERFAQGDIEEKEYRARLEVLRANASRPGPAQG